MAEQDQAGLGAPTAAVDEQRPESVRFRRGPALRLRRFAAEPQDLAEGESDVPFRRWVQIAPFGEHFTENYDEPYRLDAEGAARIVEVHEHRKAHGHEDVFDFQHASLLGGAPEDSGRAGVILRMEVRDDGVWALGEFTTRAAALIRSRDLPLVSPEIHNSWKNFDDGEWEPGPAVLAVALTGRPALPGMAAIAASVRWQALAARFGQADAERIVTLIRDAVDAGARGGVFGAVVTGDGNYQWDVRPVEIDPDWTRVVVCNQRTGQYHQATVAEAAGALVLQDIQPVRCEYVPAASTSTEEQMTEEQTAILAAVGDRTLEDLARAFALVDAAGAMTPDEVRTLAVRGPGAEQALAVRVQALAVDLQAAQTELAGLRTEKVERDSASLLDRFPTRITPAMRPHLLAWAKRAPAEVEAFAASLPEVVRLERQGTASAAPEPSPQTLHDAVLVEAKKLDPGNPMKVYEAAYRTVLATEQGQRLAAEHELEVPAARLGA